MEKINDRIKIIVDTYFQGNVSRFCRDTGIKQSTMNEILGKNHASPSIATLEKILNGCTVKVSSDWLFTGEGSIVREPKLDPEAIEQDKNELMIEMRVLWKVNQNLTAEIKKITEEYAILRYRYENEIKNKE